MQECTLIFLYKPHEKKILLAMKKRSFGKGKWNGVGGKLEKNETTKESAIREVKEEIGVEITENDLNQMAILEFLFENRSEWNNRTHIFFAQKWQGNPVETEEMRPEWYDTNKLPYDNMWVDDKHWMPRILKGEKLNAVFTFDQSGSKILQMKINSI